jgi:hypothetical protein
MVNQFLKFGTYTNFTIEKQQLNSVNLLIKVNLRIALLLNECNYHVY